MVELGLFPRLEVALAQDNGIRYNLPFFDWYYNARR
jgi:hypothetical protein